MPSLVLQVITDDLLSVMLFQLDHLLTFCKKNNFLWSINAQVTFEEFKNSITEVPVLELLDLSKSFIFETNASGLGIGAILSQERNPIAFFSKKTLQPNA